MRGEKFSIVLPTYREERIIQKTIEKIKEKYREVEIIIVDDSPDRETEKKVREIGERVDGIIYIRNREENRGLSGSVLEGIKISSKEYVVVMDADLQHPIEEVENIVKELKKGYKLVVAERSNFDAMRGIRKLSTFTAIFLGNLSLAIRGKKSFKDPVSGFFGVRKEILNEIDENKVIKKGWKICFDLLKQLKKEEVSSISYKTFKEREEGESKYNLRAVLYYLLSLIK